MKRYNADGVLVDDNDDSDSAFPTRAFAKAVDEQYGILPRVTSPTLRQLRSGERSVDTSGDVQRALLSRGTIDVDYGSGHSPIVERYVGAVARSHGAGPSVSRFLDNAARVGAQAARQRDGVDLPSRGDDDSLVDLVEYPGKNVLDPSTYDAPRDAATLVAHTIAETAARSLASTHVEQSAESLDVAARVADAERLRVTTPNASHLRESAEKVDRLIGDGKIVAADAVRPAAIVPPKVGRGKAVGKAFEMGRQRHHVRTSVAEEWGHVESFAVPTEAGASQRSDTRDAFYCGCVSMFGMLTQSMDPGREASNADLAYLTRLSEELRAFSRELEAKAERHDAAVKALCAQIDTLGEDAIKTASPHLIDEALRLRRNAWSNDT